MLYGYYCLLSAVDKLNDSEFCSFHRIAKVNNSIYEVFARTRLSSTKHHHGDNSSLWCKLITSHEMIMSVQLHHSANVVCHLI